MIVFLFLQRFLRHTAAEELPCRDDLFDLWAWLGMDSVTADLLAELILHWAHGNLLVWEGSGTVAQIVENAVFLLQSFLALRTFIQARFSSCGIPCRKFATVGLLGLHQLVTL